MGSLIEKALLIAFAIFFFYIIVEIVTEIIDMVTGDVFDLTDTWFGTSSLIFPSLFLH